MDATNDCIIGTACNYDWYDFQNYAVSLSRCGFRGRKILFVSNISKVARQTLEKLEFELIDFTPRMKHVVIERMKLLHDWLEKQDDVRFVIHCDVRDVVFQRDPSPWMEKQTAKIFGASESILYKDEACNPEWVVKLYGERGLQSLANQDVVCGGTICGEADAIKRLSLRIFESSSDRFGDDQAALNYLLRTEFKDEMIIPPMDEGFILTAGWWLIGFEVNNHDRPVGLRSRLTKTPPEFKAGVAYPQGQDEPFCIVHQYERGQRWAPAISARYVPDFSVNETQQITKQPVSVAPVSISQEGIPNGKPLKYGPNGCSTDWWDTHDRV